MVAADVPHALWAQRVEIELRLRALEAAFVRAPRAADARTQSGGRAVVGARPLDWLVAYV